MVKAGILKEMMEEILEAEALELIRCPEKNPEDLYIPYIMNDAVECYVILENCKMFGDKTRDFPMETQVETVIRDGRNGLVLGIPEGEFVTLWYDSAKVVKEFYQYHRLGHFWKKGQEQWRQLIYAIGTGYEKWEFLDNEGCNEMEKEILPLVNYAPFRYFSPINEDLNDYYPDKPEGLRLMKRLSREAGDMNHYRWLIIYEILYNIPFVSREYLQRKWAEKLLSNKRINLYTLITEKFNASSEPYLPRSYSKKQNDCMEEKRIEVTSKLRRLGFKGNYPVFRKGRKCVLAMEEHPFVIQSLDYEGFNFRINFMVSESDDPAINAGFFHGNGRIIKEMEIDRI